MDYMDLGIFKVFFFSRHNNSLFVLGKNLLLWLSVVQLFVYAELLTKSS